MLNLIEMCEEMDTSFVCPTINFDTSTPVGRMVLYILSAFAEFQRKMISESVRANMENIVKSRGLYLTSPPYGYKIDEKTGKLVIVEEEAYWIRKIVDKFISGAGYRSIARWLNHNNVTTRRKKLWSPAAVKNLLLNDVYEGKTRWKRRFYDKKGKLKWREEKEWITKQNTHEAIIKPKEKEKILKRYHEIKKGKTETAKEINQNHGNNIRQTDQRAKYKLSGLIFCAYCGSKMTSRKYSSKGPKKDKKIFICSKYQKKGSCKFNYIFLEEAEEKTLKLLNELLKTKASIKNIVYKGIKNTLISSKSNNSYTKNYEHELKLIQKKFQRQMKAYENGVISMEDLKKARQRLVGEINKIKEDEINYNNEKTFNITYDEIYDNIHTEILRIILYQIEIKDNTIIRWKLNPDIFNFSTL